MEMAISEVENRMKSVRGLKWERNDANTGLDPFRRVPSQLESQP